MADTKISALSAAASAAGANEIPINEAGTNKKVTVTQLLAFMEANIDALTSAGNVTITLGDAGGTNEVSVKDSGGNTMISLDSDGNISGVSYGGILEANLVDKAATETISGLWTHTNTLNVGVADAMVVNGAAVTGALQVNGDTNTIVEINSHSTTETPLTYFARSRGSLATPTIVASGDNLGIFYAAGYDGADYALGAAISFVVNGTPGLNDMPTKITFGVSSDGGQSPVTKLTVQEAGVDLAASTTLSIAGTAIVADSAGTATLSNIDALDPTTEATIEAAIDTLANLTVLALPNGAGGTTVDAAGEVCVDTTSKTVNFYDGTAEKVLQPEMSKSITIEAPTSSEDISMFFTDYAITITKMVCVMVGSTPSVTWTVRHGTDRSAAGAEVVTGGTTTTSTTTGSVVTTFNDATIVADSFIWVESTAQSGTVTNMNLTILYTQDP